MLAATPVRAAGDNDDAVRQLISGIMDAEYKEKKYDSALQNLEIADVVCEGDACSKRVRAELQVAIGTVYAALGKDNDARKAFSAALKDNAKATLDPKYKTSAAETAFAAAKQAFDAQATKGCRSSFNKASAKLPRGWKNAEAYHCVTQAKKAEKRKEYAVCHRDARESQEMEPRINTRVQLARCLELDNRWNDAIAEYEDLRRSAPKVGKFRVATLAAGRARRLNRQMPVLVLTAPDDTSDLVVKLDGTTLPNELLNIEMPVDPGEHLVEAESASQGAALSFEEDIELKPGKTLSLSVRLTQRGPKWATGSEMECLRNAKTPAEFRECVAGSSGPSDFNLRFGAEFSGYTDSMDVNVISPSVSIGVEHVTDGWGVGASFLVDVVSAASVDILANASPRWLEVRYAPAINGHKRFGDTDVSLAGSLSVEPDYLATSIGANVTVDLADKTVTPSLGYQFSHDVSARAETSWDVFANHINRHAISAGLGLVLTKATFGSISFIGVFEDGDLSKPYRHIPMFAPEVAAAVPAGLTIEGVNLNRLNIRPLEQLPKNRQRYALAFSLAHRFAHSTLRISERGYTDSWGVFATTTDFRFMYDLTKELRIWPHVRLHYQTDASFYRLAYQAQRLDDSDPDSPYFIPAFRTGDRELGELLGLSAGVGARYDFGPNNDYGLIANGDFIPTFFLNHLYTLRRFGFFGALTFEAEFK